GVGLKAILLSGTWALVLSLFATRWAIRQFAAWGLGQLIREDGPRSHHVKRGTPTMGGAAVAASVVVAYAVAKLATREAPTRSALLVLFLLVGMAGVGFVDDFIKVRMQRSLGLRSRAKLVGQTVVGVVFGVLALGPAGQHGTEEAVSHRLSLARDVGPALPWVVVLVFAAYTLIGSWQNSHLCKPTAPTDVACYHVASPLDLAVVAAALAGACF